MARSVLVVDDEPSILLALEFMMKNAGFEVRTARDGEEALAALAEKTPDLMLLDVMMPPPDGYDICQRVRANPAWKQVRNHHADGARPRCGTRERARHGRR